MEQAEAIWSGKHVGTRHEDEYRILLYKIDEFYVEAWYHGEYNVLRKFVPFDDKDVGTYLEYIKIDNRRFIYTSYYSHSDMMIL